MPSRLLSAAAAIFAVATYFYLNQFGDVHSVDEDGYTDLHHAAGSGHLDSLRSLIARGADVDALDASNRTALHLAALTDQHEALSLLIAANSSLDIPDKHGDSPFHLACYGCHTTSVRLLAQAGANIHMLTQNDLRHSALHVVASSDHPDTGDRCAEVARELIYAGVSLKNQDFQGLTPFVHAMSKNAIDVFRVFIEAKTDISTMLDSSDRTLLHYAAHYGVPSEMISLLLQANVPVNWMDARNKTALDFCLLRTPVIEENCVLLENAGGKSGSVNQDLESDAEDEQYLEPRTHA